MAEPARVEFTEGGRSGIVVEFTKSRGELRVWGWYDTCVGIQGGLLTLEELAALGVPVKLKKETRRG